MLHPTSDLTRVAVYRRTLPASQERVWENVRDWEHLPWLHARSFTSIGLEDEGEWGWRAGIGLRGGGEIRLELVIDRDATRYVSRTLEGPGAGGEIWTHVDARGERETRVEVEFLVPGLPPGGASKIGEHFVALYTRLWDEDEAMMVRRAEQLAARRARAAGERAALALGTLADLKSRLPLVVEHAGERFRIVEHAGRLVAHAAVCPHRLGPLEEAPVRDGRVVCPWHGYAFDVASGRECSGRRLRLAAAPHVEVEPETGRVCLVS
jgi:nitrite reductase/ring-hydroxylating ferredoxin subunit